MYIHSFLSPVAKANIIAMSFLIIVEHSALLGEDILPCETEEYILDFVQNCKSVSEGKYYRNKEDFNGNVPWEIKINVFHKVFDAIIKMIFFPSSFFYFTQVKFHLA